jgi:hypothetical protein
MKDLRAVGEERGAPLSEIQAADIELRQRGDEAGRRLALVPREALDVADEIFI